MWPQQAGGALVMATQAADDVADPTTGPASMLRFQQDTAEGALQWIVGVVDPAGERSPLNPACLSRTDIADPRVGSTDSFFVSSPGLGQRG